MNETIENSQQNPIDKLIDSFDQKRKNCIEHLENRDISKKPKNMSEEQHFNLLKARKAELDMLIVLLDKYGQNPEIQRMAKDLNKAFSYLDFKRDAPKEWSLSFFRSEREQMKKLSDKIISTMMRTLSHEQINLLDKESFSGNPEALVDFLLYWKGYDAMLKQKLISLPKEHRDKAINCLVDELYFYQYLSSDEFAQDASGDIANTGSVIIKNQSEHFDGLRGVVQKSLEGLIGERFAELIRPINYDEEDIKKIEEVVFQNIKVLQDCFDKKAFEELVNQCDKFRNINKDSISEDEAKDFFIALDNFRNSYTLPEAITNAQRELTTLAYLLSHGKENSIFENDSTVWGKIFHTESGQDNLRTLRHISPFRWGLQENVRLKPYKERLEQFIKSKDALPIDKKKKMSLEVYVSQGETRAIQGWDNIKKAGKAEEYFKKKAHGDIDSVRISSYWELGYWQEHPYQSMTVQAAEGVAITKIAGIVLRPAIRLVWEVYMGMKIGEGINEANLGKNDKYFLELIKDYESLEQMPSEEKEKLRSFVLRNEIQKRRENSQAIGYDLSKLDMQFWDQFFLGAAFGTSSVHADLNFTAGSMYQERTLQKAVESANKKLILMGLEIFNIN